MFAQVYVPGILGCIMPAITLGKLQTPSANGSAIMAQKKNRTLMPFLCVYFRIRDAVDAEHCRILKKSKFRIDLMPKRLSPVRFHIHPFN